MNLRVRFCGIIGHQWKWMLTGNTYIEKCGRCGVVSQLDTQPQLETKNVRQREIRRDYKDN